MPGKLHLIANACFPAAHAIARPRLGQIQGPIDEGGSFPAGVRQKDPHLAVLASPGGPAVLPGHSCRFLPFLDKPGFIDDQHAVLPTQVLGHIGSQVVTHRLFIPISFSKPPLHSARPLLAQFLRQLPSILALHGGQ